MTKRFGMRYILIFGFSVSVLMSNTLISPAFAEPYVAVITADTVAVRSEPAEDAYLTSQLKSGDQVEVHRETGDWLAIRPPVGSFSWIGGQFVRCGTGSTGTVLAEGLASRIGSSFSENCSAVQVRLHKGESVFILERRETPENPSCPVWLKIAPPNGEFRWIHRADTGTVNPVNKVMREGIVQTQYITSPPMPAAGISSFQRKFVELQTEANVVMKKPAADAIFAALIQRAESLHQEAATDEDLERTYHLLETLKRTRSVRKELFSFAVPAKLPTAPSPLPPLKPNASAPKPLTMPVSRPALPPSIPAPLSPAPLIQAGENVGGYDIVGKLGGFEPVPAGHPPFAVVNEKDEIICFVTPIAQLDIEPFVGQFVGINGRLGLYEKQGKPASRHITAENVKTVR